MSEQTSLASAAVDALSAVARMDADVTNEHAERHYIRTLKRLAEQSLAEAFRHARELAWMAEGVQRDAAAARKPPQ